MEIMTYYVNCPNCNMSVCTAAPANYCPWCGFDFMEMFKDNDIFIKIDDVILKGMRHSNSIYSSILLIGKKSQLTLFKNNNFEIKQSSNFFRFINEDFQLFINKSSNFVDFNIISLDYEFHFGHEFNLEKKGE